VGPRTQEDPNRGLIFLHMQPPGVSAQEDHDQATIFLRHRPPPTGCTRRPTVAPGIWSIRVETPSRGVGPIQQS
jgi:hypothetical protein